MWPPAALLPLQGRAAGRHGAVEGRSRTVGGDLSTHSMVPSTAAEAALRLPLLPHSLTPPPHSHVAPRLLFKAIRVGGGHQEQVHVLDQRPGGAVAGHVVAQPARQHEQQLPARSREGSGTAQARLSMSWQQPLHHVHQEARRQGCRRLQEAVQHATRCRSATSTALLPCCPATGPVLVLSQHSHGQALQLSCVPTCRMARLHGCCQCT
jgi:hypothetical protein